MCGVCVRGVVVVVGEERRGVGSAHPKAEYWRGALARSDT